MPIRRHDSQLYEYNGVTDWGTVDYVAAALGAVTPADANAHPDADADTNANAHADTALQVAGLHGLIVSLRGRPSAATTYP